MTEMHYANAVCTAYNSNRATPREDTMNTRQNITTHLTAVNRLRSSRNGNPSYEVETTDGTYLTAVDAGCAYALTAGMAPRPATLTLDDRQQIIGIDLHY